MKRIAILCLLSVCCLKAIDSAYLNELDNRSPYNVVLYVGDRSALPILPELQTIGKRFSQNEPIVIGPRQSKVFKNFRFPFAQEGQGRVLMLLVNSKGTIVGRFFISVQGDDRVVKATIYNRHMGQVKQLSSSTVQLHNPLDIAGSSIIGSRTQYVVLGISEKGYPFLWVKREVNSMDDIMEVFDAVNKGLEVVGKTVDIVADVVKVVKG